MIAILIFDNVLIGYKRLLYLFVLDIDRIIDILPLYMYEKLVEKQNVERW
jgi:hypothetical protein